MTKEEFDWDETTAGAWRQFQARLADRLAEMGEDDLLLLEAESADDDATGAAPYVQFCGWGDGGLRCEAVSNRYLAPLHQLDPAQRRRLLTLGFQPPEQWDGTDADNYWIDADTSDGDRLAVMAVRALRDVYGVAHPAFLAGQPFGDPVEVPALAADEDDADVEGDADDEEIAVFPTEGFEQLQGLVDDALTPWLGHAPAHDPDGDIPVDCGGVVVFVRVLPDRPMVRLFACVATDVEDLARARVEVDILNRDRVCFKFLLLGDAVVMHSDPCSRGPSPPRSCVTSHSRCAAASARSRATWQPGSPPTA